MEKKEIEAVIKIAIKKNKAVRVKGKNGHDKNLAVKIVSYKDGLVEMKQLMRERNNTMTHFMKLESVESIEILKSFSSYKGRMIRLINSKEFQKAYDVAYKAKDIFELDEQQIYINKICDLCKKELLKKVK